MFRLGFGGRTTEQSHLVFLILSSCEEVELISVIPESHRLVLDDTSLDEASLETGLGDSFNLPCSVF